MYALQNNIKDTSNRGIYHNKRFKALAEERGLQISRHETYGWTITEPTEKTLDFCIINQLEDIQIVRQTAYSIGISGGKAGSGSAPIARPKKPSSTRKYICPCCGNSFRATKTLRVAPCFDTLSSRENLSYSKINANKLVGDLFSYDEFKTAFDTILGGAGIESYSLSRFDMRFDSFDPEHYRDYAKLL